MVVGVQYEDEWFPVGHVRAQEGVSVEVAVARQRALLADHAARLFPLRISKNARVEWGYQDGEEETWIKVDKAVLEGDATEALEKKIGYEGTPDPSTGFYCIYESGKEYRR